MACAIAIDLDGTLLDSSSQVSKRSANALRLFAEKGVVVLATGRWREFAIDVAGKLGTSVSYIVCNDGRLVLRRTNVSVTPGLASEDGWQVHAMHALSGGQAARFVSKLLQRCEAHICALPISRASPVLASSHVYFELLAEVPLFSRNIRKPSRVVGDLPAALRGISSVDFLRIIPTERGVSAQKLMEVMEPLIHYEEHEHGIRWRATPSEWKLQDGTGAVILRLDGINKARGLQSLCAPNGSLTWKGAAEGKGWLCFGDSYNDIEMLQWAEYSIAPSNASWTAGAREAAKELSEFSNDEEFVARRVEQELVRARL